MRFGINDSVVYIEGPGPYLKPGMIYVVGGAAKCCFEVVHVGFDTKEGHGTCCPKCKNSLSVSDDDSTKWFRASMFIPLQEFREMEKGTEKAMKQLSKEIKIFNIE